MKQRIILKESEIRKAVRSAIRERMEYDAILSECSRKHFKEVRYFSKDGKSMPNGIGLHRGYFLLECKENKGAFILNEGVHPQQYNLTNFRGGIIVFSTDVNAISLDKNELKNRIKQIIATFNQRINTGCILSKIINKFNKYNSTNDEIGAYSVGNSFKGKYVGDNGEEYSEKSTTIEVNGLSSEGLLRLAEMIARIFHQETVLVKDLNQNKIYFADGLRTNSSLDLSNINTKSSN